MNADGERELADLRAVARAWMDEDPDPVTRVTLAELIGRAEGPGTGHGTWPGTGTGTANVEEAIRELRSCFSGRLQFGTAGLRGAMGPGPNRMNRMVVRQAAAGLAATLREQGGHTVVIGFDARHQSDAFAVESAAVFAGAGLRALMLPRALPTPVLAFAVRHLGCDAGVMVTASHNPPQDNGYKVYLGDGSQIVPPADAQISARIEECASRPLSQIPLGDQWQTLGDDVLADYIAQAATLSRRRSARHSRVAYTPLHGVGGEVFEAVLQAAGLPAVIRVEEQFAPDADFPTVAFPNPEEPGAMDLAIATARRSDACLVIAHDPDADRCAAAIPAPGQAGGWRVLHGDEVGSLLAWWLVSQPRTGSSSREPDDDRGVLAQSIVSGTMLASIAGDAGVGYAQTLTGFKWISRVPGLLFGYEEALGYCVDPAHVRDKDGITAALVLIEMADALREQGRTVQDALDELDRRHGVHATEQLSIRFADLSGIAAVIDRLRAQPPALVAGSAVERVDDLSLGADALPPTDGLRLTLAGGGRVIVRPSGTEPKLKCYLQVIEPASDDLAGARDRAAARLQALRDAMREYLTP
ncbi:MAG: phospho-sugar mutase [Actinomycetales bacterium]|nr:phospho-sugar mutase [Actinomycetales bacterium]